MSTSIYREQRRAITQQTLEQCAGIVERAKTRKIFSHVTALKLLGIELPQNIPNPDNLLDVCVDNRHHRSKMKGVRFHYWQNHFNPLCVKRDIWCSHPLDVWLQMSQFLNLTELVILAESILRRGRGVRYSDFCPQLLSSLLFRGHHLCEKALPLIREGADSPTETYLRLLLIKNGLPEPSINYAVPGVCWAGRFPIKFDLGYEQQRVLIEYDGRHHAEINQRFIDNEKRTFIESLGWRVLVIDSEEIKNIDEMCARIKRLVVM